MDTKVNVTGVTVHHPSGNLQWTKVLPPNGDASEGQGAHPLQRTFFIPSRAVLPVIPARPEHGGCSLTTCPLKSITHH